MEVGIVSRDRSSRANSYVTLETFLSSYSRKLFNMEATCKTLYTYISLSIFAPLDDNGESIRIYNLL